MATGDPVCPDCGSYNCRRDYLGRTCRQRFNNAYWAGDPNYQHVPNPQFFWNPPVYHIPTYPNFVTPVVKFPWQCPGCKRHYAPHVDSCDCQVITYGTTTGSDIPPVPPMGDNQTPQN